MEQDDRDVIEELVPLPGDDRSLIDEGWGIWDRGDPSGEPLALYPPDDDGFELALEHFRRLSRAACIQAKQWLGVLRWAAIVSGGLWIVSSAVARLVFAIQWPRSPRGFDAVFAWSQAIEDTAYPAFVVSVGMYVILWLRSRQRPAHRQWSWRDSPRQLGSPRECL
jgi:hypothetical protein